MRNKVTEEGRSDCVVLMFKLFMKNLSFLKIIYQYEGTMKEEQTFLWKIEHLIMRLN